MNIKSFTKQVAVFTLIAGTAAVIHAQIPELTGDVPVDFKAVGKTLEAGTYRIAKVSAHAVVLRYADGRNAGFLSMPVQTEDAAHTNKTVMTFQRNLNTGSYEIAGYCFSGQGCWTSGGSGTKGSRVEVALKVRK